MAFPGCFASVPKDPITHLSRFKLEEMCTLLWSGVILAQGSPPDFAKLWTLLSIAARHYLYSFESNNAVRQEAQQALQKYAEELEKRVVKGVLPHKLLKPNLHVATCRLYQQERARGPPADDAEWFMERLAFFVSQVFRRCHYSLFRLSHVRAIHPRSFHVGTCKNPQSIQVDLESIRKSHG